MKKFLLVTVLSLGSLTAFAQDTETSIETDAEATVEMQQDEYTSIEVSELPAAITDALAKDHPDVQVNSAYVNDESEYKLEVAKEDGTTFELYADAEGNWLEM